MSETTNETQPDALAPNPDADLAGKLRRCVRELEADLVRAAGIIDTGADTIDRAAGDVCALAARVRELEAERDELKEELRQARAQLKDLVENAASTRAVERAELAETELTARRAYDDDVRACAEYTSSRASSPILEDAARRLLAAEFWKGES